MHQTNHFFNLGYGWLCKHCTAEDAERKQHNQQLNRSQSSAEPAEERSIGKLSNLALAKWVDEERHGLACPRCGIEEHLTRM
jgi:hypothetical protein